MTFEQPAKDWSGGTDKQDTRVEQNLHSAPDEEIAHNSTGSREMFRGKGKLMRG